MYNHAERREKQYRMSMLQMAFIWSAALLPSVHAVRKVIVQYCACTLPGVKGIRDYHDHMSVCKQGRYNSVAYLTQSPGGIEIHSDWEKRLWSCAGHHEFQGSSSIAGIDDVN